MVISYIKTASTLGLLTITIVRNAPIKDIEQGLLALSRRLSYLSTVQLHRRVNSILPKTSISNTRQSKPMTWHEQDHDSVRFYRDDCVVYLQGSTLIVCDRGDDSAIATIPLPTIRVRDKRSCNHAATC